MFGSLAKKFHAVQQILLVPQGQQEADVEHHRQADDHGAGKEVAEGAGSGHLGKPGGGPTPASRIFALTVPETRVLFGLDTGTRL